MYKRRAYSQREQDYSLELRNKLEEAEKMLLKIGPCRERSLANWMRHCCGRTWLLQKLAWQTMHNKNAPAVSRSKMNQFSVMS